MKDVAKTALVTLKCHIQDTQQRKSILDDESSLEMFKYLSVNLGKESKKVLNNRLKKSLVKHTVLRAQKYDSYVKTFLEKHPNGNVINIGCGLDNRFARIDNNACSFWDLDLPDIMEIKKEVFPPNDRYMQISGSVFEFDWLNRIENKPTILLAEGVFMFCNEKDVKSLFNEIHDKIPGVKIVFEVFSSNWLTGWKKKIIDFKLQKELKFGKNASFHFGIAKSNEIEGWSENYKLIEDWSYFDVVKSNVKNYFRKIQWTVYYEIN